MALDKIASTVLTRYKADTTDHRRELKKLRGAERRAHKEKLQELEEQNAKLDGQIAMWGKVAVGVGAVAGAAAVAWKGVKTLQENSRRAAATVGADLDGLRKATSGLVKDTELLDFAAKAMNGTFKLNNKQMQDAVRGALALRKTLGVDLEKALEVTQKAITEGTVEPLKELGIVVKDVTNDTEEGLNAALAALREQARAAGPDLKLPGDELSQSAVKMENSMNKLMEALGRLAIKLAPVVEQFATLVGFVASLPDLADSALFAFEANSLKDQVAQKEAVLAGLRKRNTGWTAGSLDGEIALLEKELAVQRAQLNKQRGRATGDLVSKAARGALGSVKSTVSSLSFTGGASPGAGGSRSGGGGGGGPIDLSGSVVQSSQEMRELDLAMMGAIARSERTGDLKNPFGKVERVGEMFDLSKEQENLAKVRAEFEKIESMKRADGMLESIFGTPAEVSLLNESIGMLASSFETLAGAAQAGLQAWITGSEDAGTAFKKFVGESLIAMAVDMGIRSLREAAMGTAMLWLNPAQSATHFKAAGMFAGGALAAGLGAKAMGAGRWAGPSSTAGAAGAGGRGGTIDHRGEAGGNRTKVYILGESFGGMSARERESRFRQMGRAAGMTFEGDVIQDG